MLHSITPEEPQLFKTAYCNIQRQLKLTHLHLVTLLVIVDRDPANKTLFVHLLPCLTILTLPKSCAHQQDKQKIAFSDRNAVTKALKDRLEQVERKNCIKAQLKSTRFQACMMSGTCHTSVLTSYTHSLKRQ